MLEAHQSVPHFDAVTLDGRPVAYRTIWQRCQLLLIAVPPERSPARDRYLDSIDKARGELTAHDTALVVTSTPIEGLPPSGLVIADRWGEIQFTVTGLPIERLPDPAVLVEWLRFVQVQCPECQGEAR